MGFKGDAASNAELMVKVGMDVEIGVPSVFKKMIGQIEHVGQ